MPTSINVHGTIAGYYGDSNFVEHGFVRDREGNIATFDVPGAANTFAYRINAGGKIVGWYTDTAQNMNAFARDPSGELSVLPGGQSCSAVGINERGAIILSCGAGPFLRRPDGALKPIELPHDCLSDQINREIPTAINSTGVVAGLCATATGNRGWVGMP